MAGALFASLSMSFEECGAGGARGAAGVRAHRQDSRLESECRC